MTPQRALQIMHRVWVQEEVLSWQEAKEIEAVELLYESALETVGRIAGVPVADMIAAYRSDHQVSREISKRIAQREIELARGMP